MATRESISRMRTIDLIRRTINNVSDLLDRQIELAKVEARETAMDTVRGARTLIIGAVLALLAVVSLVVAAILALALVMPGWAAALIVFAIFVIAAVIALLIGRNQVDEIRRNPLGRTRETLKEDVQWAKRPLTSSEK